MDGIPRHPAVTIRLSRRLCLLATTDQVRHPEEQSDEGSSESTDDLRSMASPPSSCNHKIATSAVSPRNDELNTSSRGAKRRRIFLNQHTIYYGWYTPPPSYIHKIATSAALPRNDESITSQLPLHQKKAGLSARRNKRKEFYLFIVTSTKML